MAGGPDTPALAGAVSHAGGLGSLGCAYASPAQIETLAQAVRAVTDRPFALNLFVRADSADDPAAEARVESILSAFRTELGISGPAPATSPPRFEDQLDAVLRA